MGFEIGRDYELVHRNDKGRQHIIDWFEKRGWATEQIEVGKTAPVISALRMGDDGNIWVRLDQGGHGADTDLLAVYDVISPDGQYLKQLRLHTDLEIDSRQMLDDSTVLIMVTDEDDGEVYLVLQKTAP